MKDIYKMMLHEVILMPNGTSVMKVPGGWLYGYWDNEKHTNIWGTFVPYDGEFRDGGD